jgi:hypothetical protein
MSSSAIKSILPFALGAATFGAIYFLYSQYFKKAYDD